MPKKVTQDDPEQYKRFVEDAKRLGCDDPEALGKVLKPEVVKTNKPRKKTTS